MIFDRSSGKGVRKKSIPEPNPRKVEMSRMSSLVDIFQKAKELYFYPKCDIDEFKLGDGSGMLVEVAEKESWSLQKYYDENSYKPSRHKVYVVLYGKV